MNTNDKEKSHLHKLIEQSENRIDRTNEMICQLVSVVERLTNEYADQITKLQQARDNLIEQNQRLIKLYEARNNEFDLLNKKYDHLIDMMMNKNHSENNISVKQ